MQSRCFSWRTNPALAIFTVAFVLASTLAIAGEPAPATPAKASLQALKTRSADPDKKALVQILRDVAEHPHTVFLVEKSEVTKDTAKAFADWEAQLNLPFGDGEMSTSYYKMSVSMKSSVPIFIADFSGSNPTKFRIIAVAQGGKVLGESIDVAN